MSLNEKKNYILNELKKNGYRLLPRERCLLILFWRMSAVAARKFTTGHQKRMDRLAWQPFIEW